MLPVFDHTECPEPAISHEAVGCHTRLDCFKSHLELRRKHHIFSSVLTRFTFVPGKDVVLLLSSLSFTLETIKLFFSFISINWRATSHTSLEAVLELISYTTEEGLTVTALKDSQNYAAETKVTEEELVALHPLRDSFHGEWTDTILPHASLPSGQLI